MKSDYETRVTKKNQLYEAFKSLKIATTNEAIDFIYKEDLKKGDAYMLRTGWRYYVHLNKQTIYLQREMKVVPNGFKTGTLGRPEQIWKVI